MGESRVDELEIKVSYQEDTIQTLNEALRAQQDRLDALEKRIAQIEQRAEAGDAAAAVSDPADERPPHY